MLGKLVTGPIMRGGNCIALGEKGKFRNRKNSPFYVKLRQKKQYIFFLKIQCPSLPYCNDKMVLKKIVFFTFGMDYFLK
jgi:hypothetical protein